MRKKSKTLEVEEIEIRRSFVSFSNRRDSMGLENVD